MPDREVKFSFKYKLVLAMVVVVTVISVAELYVTRVQVQDAYRDFFDIQIEKEVIQFREQQQFRIQPKIDLIKGALNSARLVAAVEAQDFDSFYSDLTYELRNLLDDSGSIQHFFVFVDYEGNVIRPGRIDHPNLIQPDHEQLYAKIEKVSDKTVGLEETSTAYLPLHFDGSSLLYEVILTPFFDQEFDSDPWGTIIIGSPLGIKESAKEDSIKSALMIDRILFSKSIPADAHQAVLDNYDSQLKNMESKSRLTIAGYPFMSRYDKIDTFEGFPDAVFVTLNSLKGFEDMISGIEKMVIGFTVVALSLGLILSWAISSGMTRPIMSLVNGTKRISEGDYDVEVPVNTTDEIGLLARSFNEMGKELSLKEKYRDLLERVSDKDVAEELLSGSLVLGGELRDVAVLFCDIRGFTSLTEGMSPEEVIDMLNEHMTALSEIATSHHGVIDKFVGDEIMILFGAPKSYGNDPLNAVKCADAMIKRRAEINGTGKYDIKIGIGIAYGEVVAGRMGSENRLDYTVLGENVNLAARLCGKAGKMEVLISDGTYNKISDDIKATPVDDLSLKGFSAGKKAYLLQSA